MTSAAPAEMDMELLALEAELQELDDTTVADAVEEEAAQEAPKEAEEDRPEVEAEPHETENQEGEAMQEEAEQAEEPTEAEAEPAPADDEEPAKPAAPAAAAPKKKPSFVVKKKTLDVAKAAAPEEEPEAADAAPAKPAAKKKGLAVPKAPAKPAAAKPAAAKPAAAKPVAKPAAAKPATKPAAAKAQPLDAAKPAGAAVKGRTSAYIFFCNDKRAGVQAENSELSSSELMAKLGEVWKGLSDEEKAPYQAQAEADKQRYAADVEAAGGAEAVAAARKSKPKKAKKAKTAFQLYCDDTRAGVRAENPNAGAREVEKLLSAGWSEASAEDKAEYERRHKELKAAAPAEDKDEGEPTKKRPAASAAAPRKRAKKAGKGASAADAEADEERPSAEEEEESDDEQERLACDWEAHPAECILSETKTGKYLVARQGLGFEGYGLVDAKAAKLQRLGQSSSEPLPVSLEMIEEYEAGNKAFRSAVHNNQDCGELDLSELPAGSALEACFILGRLREPGYELHRKDKGDIDMKVPMLATCRVIQRLISTERQRGERHLQRALAAERELAELRGGKGAAAAAGVSMEA